MLQQIAVPTLLLDESKARRNINRMVQRAQRAGLPLRPHFKTHQSGPIGQWFRERGVDRIAVSSLRMAEYFANRGWTDITNAFPVNIREMDRIQKLAAKVRLQLLVENTEAIEALRAQVNQPLSLFIKINCGNDRTGLRPENRAAIDACLQAIDQSTRLAFRGFLAHAGHTYAARGKEDIARIHFQTLRDLDPLIRSYRSRYPDLVFSYGDTPSCSTMEDFGPVDELRPGNFVFYDLMQARIGSCDLEDIAVALACPVVAKHPDRMDIVLFGGGVHLSKDHLSDRQTISYGQPVKWTDRGWTVIDDGQSYVRKLSQEHGILRAAPALFQDVQIGDLMGIVPVHSCMTADLMKTYQTLQGTQVEMMTYV